MMYLHTQICLTKSIASSHNFCLFKLSLSKELLNETFICTYCYCCYYHGAIANSGVKIFLYLERSHSRDSLVNIYRVFKTSFGSQNRDFMNFNTVEHES